MTQIVRNVLTAVHILKMLCFFIIFSFIVFNKALYQAPQPYSYFFFKVIN